ncbi:MAG TPA: lanthionine synthetase C family protein [Streptosporangiaceae bacterium]|nr:lanthionine synthetase C family protein [Streptosporangiaceae bacterium]
MRAEPARDAPVGQKVAGASRHSQPRSTQPRRPLLAGTLKDDALDLAGALARALPAAAATDHRNPSLASGSAGLAVCAGHLARTRSDQAAETALTHLEDAVDMLATEPLTASLYSGFTGIAWAVEQVDRLLGTENEDEDRNGAIDEALASLLPRYPQDAPYDLINGLTGLGVYALARWPRPGAASCLLGVTGQLARRAREDGDGIYWWTPSSWRGPRGERYRPAGVDLGVAHGIAGVIPFLARVHRLGLAQPVVRRLLDGSVAWLLAHLVEGESGPTVPYFVADGIEPGPARSAWCYGDPGVALALLLAAHDVGEPDWATVAAGLALRAAARPAGQSGVTDAGLCHGSAGLAHLFNRLYQLTAEQALADAARCWIERTLELCSAPVPDESASGTDAHGTAAPGAAAPGRVPLTPAARTAGNGPGLLEGSAGVALALEAAGTAAEPAWDQMLLVSSPPDPGARER